MIKSSHRVRALSVFIFLLSTLTAQSPVQAQAMAWVSSEKDNAIALVDLAQGKVTATVPTCKRPRHMQLSPDRKQMMVACSDAKSPLLK